jgi:hypothetical protein
MGDHLPYFGTRHRDKLRVWMRLRIAVVMGLVLALASAACDRGSSARDDAGKQDSALPLVDSSHEGGMQNGDAGRGPSKDGGRAGSDSGFGTAGGAGASAVGGAGGAAGSGTAHDDDGGPSIAPSDSGVAPIDAGMNDAQVANDSCDLDDAGVPTSESFTVPAGGGRFEFCSSSGMVRFDFPAALAGLQVVATSVDPHTFTWPHPGFAEVMIDAIRLEASASFTQPVRIRLPNGLLIAFLFHADSTVPLPLRLSSDRTSLELWRAGTIGVVAPERSCESTRGASFTNGWLDSPESGSCSGHAGKSTWRRYECSNNPYCHAIISWCCVYPGDARIGCMIDDAIIYNDFSRQGPNAAYPYCDGASDSPYVQSVAPVSLIANYMDQTVTLTGNGFLQNGYVSAGETEGSSSSVYIASNTWISSTTVSAVVHGRALDRAGEIWIGYLNPDDRGDFDWFRRQSNSVRVSVVAPAVMCPVPGEGSPAIGLCSSLPNGCQCSVDFDPGDGPHTYAMTCIGAECSCARDGLIVSTKPRVNACNDDLTTQEQWKLSCLSTPGFCR